MAIQSTTQIRKALQTQFPTYDVVESFSDGPALQQLHTFAVASVVVAPHTAGLSGMIVSPLHTPVLEIGPPTCSSGYMHLAVKVSAIEENVRKMISYLLGFGVSLSPRAGVV